jgi:metal-responsive CopG/Arc/MetJ family transcriptional regulator
MSGFTSKSEALRDSIFSFIEKHEKYENLENDILIMTISLAYPFKDLIIDHITEIYSKFHPIIKTITDWRIAEKKIELLLVVGEFYVIRDLYKELVKIKDVVCTIREIVID